MSDCKLIIAIDGYSACGKSTTAKGVAKALSYRFIDTGAMYRCVTLYALQQGLNVAHPDDVIRHLDKVDINFVYDPASSTNRVLLNGTDVSEQIRSMTVNDTVSAVAAIPAVRHFLVEQQQQMGNEKGIVMDGRDIGTTVFPQAELKIFMQADLDVRARRRVMELEAKGEQVDFAEVEKNLSARDQLDSTRTESPLRKAADALILDSTHRNIEDQVDFVVDRAKELIKKGC